MSISTQTIRSNARSVNTILENGIAYNGDEYTYWIPALLTWGLLDIATTYVGTTFLGLSEANGKAQIILEMFGYGGLVAIKIVVIVSLFALNALIVKRQYRHITPLTLSIIGNAIVVINTTMILITLIT